MNNLTSIVILFLFIVSAESSNGNDTLRVLFIGNSYTYVNDLPGLTRDFSASKGKTLLIDSYALGGYSWSQHATDASCLAKIRQGGWDAVVLQEQSQMPTIPFYRDNYSTPGIRSLTDSIVMHNPCARIMLFMTWGRRFGGQQCINGNCSPVFVDFNHMQDSLSSAYLSFAEETGVACSPVGMAWRKALEDSSTVLHSSDNSHPAVSGSYLAACVFYDMLWKDVSAGSPFTAGLTSSAAERFQEIADSTVFLSTSDWGINIDVPAASFTSAISGYQVDFTNTSIGRSTISYQWDFGDGSTSSSSDPTHQYATSGNYVVTLIVEDCGNIDSISTTLTISPSSIDEQLSGSAFTVCPNPADLTCTIGFSNDGTHVVSILNMEGKMLNKEIFNGRTLLLNTGNLPGGFYFLIVDDKRKKLSVVH